jgi:23S rRNA (cytosine1962-C5)-methyltransferase
LAADPQWPTLQLKAREDRRIRAGHLWVYSNEIDVAATPLKSLEPGQVARLVSQQGRFLGYAGVSPNSLIAARILGRDPAHPPGRSLFVHRLKVALGLRERLYPGGCYRLLFGDSDLLPGVVVDRFGDYVVLQAGTATAEAMKGTLVDAVREVLSPRGVLWRNDGGARDLEGLPRYTETAAGEVPDSVPVIEGGIEYAAPIREGQKTGWFYDQRDNRQRFERYASGRVLDVFCYTGAWGLSAAVRGAEAAFVDASASALEAVEDNAARLGVAAERHQGSAFDVLRSLRSDGRRFDAVVVDPPAFIKRRKDHRKGLTAYQRINQLAMTLLEREGLLVSCSCSQHLSIGDLLSAVERAARHVDRHVQVLEIGGQAADHPIHPAIAETRYLKALFCRVLPA